MLEKIPILLTLCCVAAQTLKTKDPVLLKLTPEQIRDTFDNVMSDDYIKVLAKDFASKAAQHFMKEMNSKKAALAEKLSEQMYRSPAQPAKKPEIAEETEKPIEATTEVESKAPDEQKDVLNSREALRLLKDPSPDGDHLGSQSGEFSGESTLENIPVIEVMKINGVYFRRLLGLI